MEREDREYGVTPNLGEFGAYGLPLRYWGCDARYFAEKKGKRRIEVPPNRETYWGFSDKDYHQIPQEEFLQWINGVLFPLLRRHAFETPYYAVVDPEFIKGKVFVGHAKMNRTRTQLRIGTWERDPAQRFRSDDSED